MVTAFYRKEYITVDVMNGPSTLHPYDQKLKKSGEKRRRKHFRAFLSSKFCNHNGENKTVFFSRLENQCQILTQPLRMMTALISVERTKKYVYTI
jgi:hypothetical protein